MINLVVSKSWRASHNKNLFWKFVSDKAKILDTYVEISMEVSCRFMGKERFSWK